MHETRWQEWAAEVLGGPEASRLICCGDRHSDNRYQFWTDSASAMRSARARRPERPEVPAPPAPPLPISPALLPRSC
jgi:hypothetical protein